MEEISTVFIEGTHSLGTKFLKVLQWAKNLTVGMIDEIINLLVPIINFATPQRYWLNHFHGKASETRDQPSVRRDIGVGSTPRFSRKVSGLSFGPSQTEVGPKPKLWSKAVHMYNTDSCEEACPPVDKSPETLYPKIKSKGTPSADKPSQKKNKSKRRPKKKRSGK